MTSRDIFDQVVAISSVDNGSSHRNFLKNSVRHRAINNNRDIDGLLVNSDIKIKAYPMEY